MKSVCRLRAVCKSWNALIPSPFFVKLRDSFTRSIASSSKVFNLRDDVPFPFRFRVEAEEDVDLYRISIVDVVHGVVFVSYTMDSSYDSTILWNPAIHKYLTLPRLPFPSHIDSAVSGNAQVDPDDVPQNPGQCARFFCTAIGFGYDRYMEDFKVVRVWMSCECIESHCGFIPTTYDVYSTRQGLWSKAATANNLKSVTFATSRTATGRFVNGAICWVAMSLDLQEHYVIIFDCQSQELTMVDFPQETYEPKIYPQNAVRVAEVLEYGGMLSVLVDRRWDLIELWAMKQLGSPATWHKLITIDNLYGLSLYRRSFLMQVPHGPKQWIKFQNHVDRFHPEFAYVESMFLIGDSKAKPYTDNETVHISIPASPYS